MISQMGERKAVWFVHAVGVYGLLCLPLTFGTMVLMMSGPGGLVCILLLPCIASVVAGIVTMAIGHGALAKVEGSVAVVTGVVGLLFIGYALRSILITAISYP